jgi:hypothetical protein
LIWYQINTTANTAAPTAAISYTIVIGSSLHHYQVSKTEKV